MDADATLDPQRLERWIGRTETTVDVIDARQARLIAATLGAGTPGDGDPLPPLWHWAYFAEARPPEALGRDGHPKRGGFLPPVALPRRMWAGGRFTFEAPLRIGESAEKHSRIEALSVKEGRSGPLCFVTVSHAFTVNGTSRFREEHDIVYREDPKPDARAPEPPMAPQGAEHAREMTADPVLLFRYSAATFNGHRIHYDRDYARTVEGYPDLVVHGPLLGTLLAAHAMDMQPDKPLARYSFRARSPVFSGERFTLNGRAEGPSSRLWITKADGVLAMEAEAEFG